MFSQAGVDAICSATYLEDYLEALESLPDQIQRHVSEIRRLDTDYFDVMKKIKQLKHDLMRYGVRNNDYQLDVNAGTSEETVELPPEERRAKRSVILKQLKYQMLRSQSIADYKLAELACINELIEARTRRLEQDSKNMELDFGDNNGVTSKMASSSHSAEGCSSTQERAVRSIMRGFYRGEKERASDSNIREENHQAQRADKHPSAASIASMGAAALLSMASEAESEAASPSAAAAALLDAASAARQTNKRPRRQKQFPDFVREMDTSTATNANANANGGNGFNPMSPAVASPAPNPPNTRSNKERISNSGNLAQANKRKKKRQKPDVPSGGGGGKIKFNLPIDPDEPTYCLCEQVSYGEMIGCDNGDCDIEWFHFNCVGLTSKPKGKWYCPNCRGDRPNIMKSSK